MKEIYCTVWTKKGKQELTYKQWRNFDWNKLHHNRGGPAAEWPNGAKWWYVDGKPHRLDGPAIEYLDGINSWYIHGNRLNTKEIETWLEENKVDLKDPEGQMAFKLRFA